ncbi:Crp/Fnr family transcriptional regulator [Haliea sp. E1-2-M8]|uniref:Crp/Fnr family transcriptional regulator n=1 Tax=Haliea sp. E1-2-M8 TaxID=3064706 RepID=UPI00271930A4|nr:Crp/Fnr family transcriptional regulator [Haliea sp. E1-2-M8]MDO8862108.1 Crp/Fnr family transcriptional regulator [Haliea sp. E1-2-M8]
MQTSSPLPTTAPIANRLIEKLPPLEHAHFMAHCEQVELQVGHVLCESETPFQHVYFPMSGVISMVKVLNGHQSIETEQIGNEGMLGVTVLLGVDVAPERSVVQASGTALQMPPRELLEILKHSPVAARYLKHYLYVMILQLTQTATCFRFHDVAARLARALLTVHDRAHSDHFHLTHQVLADMLGVQRGGVTIAAGHLQRANIIHYTRGHISILDRKALEAESCDCYGMVMDGYARLLP